MSRRRRGEADDALSVTRAARARAIAESVPPDGSMDASRLSAAALLELARAKYHLRAARKRKRKPPLIGAEESSMSLHTDTPPELAEQADGLSDDGAMSESIIGAPEIIGCACDSIGGVPSYLWTRKGLTIPVVRRRLRKALEAMTPKVRRRALARLRDAVRKDLLVSGIVRATPTISGSGFENFTPATASGPGWREQEIVGRCPLSSVAGPLTP